MVEGALTIVSLPLVEGALTVVSLQAVKALATVVRTATSLQPVSLSNPSSDTDVNSNHENSPSKRGSDTYTLEEKDALKNFPGNEYPPGWDNKLDITWIGGDLSDAGVGFESLQIDDEDD